MKFKAIFGLALTCSAVLFGCSTAGHHSGLPLRYHNAQYGFAFSLPADWQGYSALIQEWDGERYSPATDKVIVNEHGPMILLRHPAWKTGSPRQDIPVLVFSRAQWDVLQQGKFTPSLYAGGVMQEMWRNRGHVFAINSRYNADDSISGWKEAAAILEQNCVANHVPSSTYLYLHLYASYIFPEPPRLILSAPVPPAGDFDIPMGDGQQLKGRVEPRNGKYFIHFLGRLCSGTNVFDGEVDLEQRYEPWQQPYDAKAPFICQPHFVLSSTSSPKPFLKQQAVAERKAWNLRNPFTARQLAEIKRKFQLLRPGMTRDAVFVRLGLSGYENRLAPMIPLHHSGTGEYQLADGERLLLFFSSISNNANSLVVRAELDTVTASGDGPPVWRAILAWP